MYLAGLLALVFPICERAVIPAIRRLVQKRLPGSCAMVSKRSWKTCVSQCGTMREAGKRCGIKDSAALVLKRRIAADLMEFFGEEVIRRLLDGVKPGWESDLRTVRDRHVSNGSETARNESC